MPSAKKIIRTRKNGRTFVKNRADFHPPRGDINENAYLRSLGKEESSTKTTKKRTTSQEDTSQQLKEHLSQSAAICWKAVKTFFRNVMKEIQSKKMYKT